MHDNTVMSTQLGVFRTNCIDCLDRTNVVQSMLAKNSLLEQLKVVNFNSNKTMWQSLWWHKSEPQDLEVAVVWHSRGTSSAAAFVGRFECLRTGVADGLFGDDRLTCICKCDFIRSLVIQVDEALLHLVLGSGLGLSFVIMLLSEAQGLAARGQDRELLWLWRHI